MAFEKVIVQLEERLDEVQRSANYAHTQWKNCEEKIIELQYAINELRGIQQ